MALNDTFTIQEINLDKKDFSCDLELKKIEDFWNKECAEHQVTTIARSFNSFLGTVNCVSSFIFFLLINTVF